MFGIEAIEIHFPKTYVDQKQYCKFLSQQKEIHKEVSQGKYTIGLGQQKLGFTYEFQDINSISLTVVNNLLKNNNINPMQIGRLEVGTETIIDKSKSTKTVLMELFKQKGNHDIQGVTSINACYGGTNALFNTLNWISSSYWDGRYGIVVMADIALYEDGPARATGGAGAIALLIGPKGKITFERERASFMDNQYDFYKPNPSSQYPIVDGNLSIKCYLKAIEQCYLKLREKNYNKNFLQEVDFYCFHAPFHKMVYKSFSKLMKLKDPVISEQKIAKQFKQKAFEGTEIPRKVGNMYTASLYSGLISLLMNQPQISNKSVLMFSYGSGLCSSMFLIKIHSNPLPSRQINQMRTKLQNRIKITAAEFTRIMLEREQNYLKQKGRIIQLKEQLLDDNVFYLREIDQFYRRFYAIKNNIQFNHKQTSVLNRLKHINRILNPDPQPKKFYQLSIPDRIDIINKSVNNNIDKKLLNNGGLTLELADTMIENVIGKLSLPLAVVPMVNINNKKYIIPMCIEEPSVVAAVSSIGKLLENHPFVTSSTDNMMIGQVHLPQCTIQQVQQILFKKATIIRFLNKSIPSMVSRGGGVQDFTIRNISLFHVQQNQKNKSQNKSKNQYVIDIKINVCDAMGANITNMICQKMKQIINQMEIHTGIAVLSNFSVQRRAYAYFQVQIHKMQWKGVKGIKVVEKILEAYQFAQLDKFRATTHNKGIMNGVGAVCLATGQDWRAVESSAHAFACKNGKYNPLTHYQIVNKNGIDYFKGSLELPIAVGTKGGVVEKNSLYKTTLQILGNPSAQQLSQIMVVVGLAQNFAALRALAIEGIQKGHMVLHARTIAQKAGIPKNMIGEACQYMVLRNKYDIETAKLFLQLSRQKPRL